MGIRNKVRTRMRKMMNKFSGEHSVPAPDTFTPYERPGVPNEDAEIVWPKLNRPKAGGKKDS